MAILLESHSLEIVVYILSLFCYYPMADAPVAQWLVLVLPKHETRVRFPSGALSPLGQLTEGVLLL